MTIIRFHENPAEYAPTFFFNHCGTMPWSGRHESEFSGLELIELFQFCEEEGHRQGINDANQDRIGSREEAPFHQDFMGGYPKSLWEDAYWIGVQAHDDTTPVAIELEIQKVLSAPDTSRWLCDALNSALDRDSTDAMNDAEFLCDLLMRRTNALSLASEANWDDQ